MCVLDFNIKALLWKSLNPLLLYSKEQKKKLLMMAKTNWLHWSWVPSKLLHCFGNRNGFKFDHNRKLSLKVKVPLHIKSARDPQTTHKILPLLEWGRVKNPLLSEQKLPEQCSLVFSQSREKPRWFPKMPKNPDYVFFKLGNWIPLSFSRHVLPFQFHGFASKANHN